MIRRDQEDVNALVYSMVRDGWVERTGTRDGQPVFACTEMGQHIVITAMNLLAATDPPAAERMRRAAGGTRDSKPQIMAAAFLFYEAGVGCAAPTWTSSGGAGGGGLSGARCRPGSCR